MARLLVTGGAGFIGSHVCELAMARGWKVAVLDNLSSGRRENVPEAAEFFEVDLRDAAATSAAVASFSPTLVSHQAAQASVPVSMRDPQLDADNNVMGGLNLWSACTTVGVERLVFASTGGAIYGEVEPGRKAKVGDRELPQSPYAVSKLAVGSTASEQPLTAIRPRPARQVASRPSFMTTAPRAHPCSRSSFRPSRSAR